MSGKRQPTQALIEKGAKHFTQAEIEERLDAEVHIAPPAEAVPPTWLRKKFHAEFREIGKRLISAGLYAELDRDVLAQYFVCRDGWQNAEKLAAKAIREKDDEAVKTWTSVQASYFKQCRQCGDAMGLSVSARCRLVIPGAGQASDEPEDEFTQQLKARRRMVAGG